jgi:hypothetical protein
VKVPHFWPQLPEVGFLITPSQVLSFRRASKASQEESAFRLNLLGTISTSALNTKYCHPERSELE